MANTPLIAFRLEERDNLRLRRLAASQHKSLSDFIRDAVKREMDRQESNNQ